MLVANVIYDLKKQEREREEERKSGRERKEGRKDGGVKCPG